MLRLLYIRKGVEARGGGTPHMKGVGMLVVWLSSDFGLTEDVQGKKQSQLAVKVSFRVAREKILKYVCCPCFNMVSFRAQKKVGLRSVSFRGLIQNYRQASPPLSYAEFPPPPD